MQGYNFTERVRKALAMAREEAGRLHHEYVGTEHILLGLIREGEGVAAVVLQNLGVDPERVKDRIEEVVQRGKASPQKRVDLPYTSRAKKVLELAMSEARELHHSYVGTEHVLLGLIREEKGIASQVLQESGATLDEARAETLRILGTQTQEDFVQAASGLPTGWRPEPRTTVSIPLQYDFTDPARWTLSLARDEAVRLSHEAVSVEHLLLALVAQESGAVNIMLEMLRVDREVVRAAIEGASSGTTAAAPPEKHPLTPVAQRVLRFATSEAHEEKHLRVGTAHLLIAALREQKEPAVQAAAAAGLTLVAARAVYARIAG